MWLIYLLTVAHINTKSAFLKIIANAKDPKFSNIEVEIYQANISKVNFV